MIPQSVLAAYQAQAPLVRRLDNELKRLMVGRPRDWFFVSRVKEEESFAQKVESGRVPDPSKLEDFLGAMLVVPRHQDIEAAVAFVEQFYSIKYRRPPRSDRTSKSSSDFRFDDLRLYGTLRSDPVLPHRPIDAVVFEIQVKTFLQHAWSVATHDLVYKFDRSSWARSRVAYQVKAMLEHAELSISSIEHLEVDELMQKQGQPEFRVQRVIDVVTSEWNRDDLPADILRLAQNLDGLLQILNWRSEDLRALLEAGKAYYSADHPGGWTPYQCVIDYLSVTNATKLVELLRGDLMGSRPIVVYVTPEIIRRLGVPASELVQARV
jgi:ppGpp synthetase/RelA/SpoT-type nucleotidyltranferase